MEDQEKGQSIEIPVGNCTLSSPTVAQTSGTVGTEANCDSVQSVRLLPLVPEFEDSRSNINLDSFRLTSAHGGGNDSSRMGRTFNGGDFRSYVDAEFASTRAMLQQQQSTLSSLAASLGNLSANAAINTIPAETRSKVLGKRSFHYMSQSDSDSSYTADTSDEDSVARAASERRDGASALVSTPAPDNTNTAKMQRLDELFVVKTNFGPPINESLAKTVNRGISNNFDLKQGLDLGEKFKTPENCQFLSVPKLNEELFFEESIETQYKRTDATMQKNQLLLTKGMIPIVKMMDLMIEKKTGDDELFDLATESMQLLAYAHRDLSNIRRKMLKPAVASKYQKLRTPSVPLTSQLFGDDLEKQLKSITESKRIGQLATVDERKHNRRSYGSHPKRQGRRARDYRPDAAFLYQRSSHRGRSKKYHRQQQQHQQQHQQHHHHDQNQQKQKAFR